jgi:hypothetical protein
MNSKTKSKPFDLVGSIIAFEDGTLSGKGTLDLFSNLIKTGQAWQLQGCYGRAAAALIERGLINREGEITEEGYIAVAGEG